MLSALLQALRVRPRARVDYMRLRTAIAFLGAAAALIGGTPLLARAPLIVDQNAESIEQVLGAVESVASYVGGARCGGWNLEESVFPEFTEDVDGLRSALLGPPNKVAKSWGIPGREGNPLDDVLSGMAVRKEPYTFPEDTEGLSTACQIWKPGDPKGVWCDKEASEGGFPGEVMVKTITFLHPFFGDPPCRWRLEGESDPPMPLPQLGSSATTCKQGGVEIPTTDIEAEELQSPPDDDDSQNPRTCAGFCQYLNRFVYRDCAEIVLLPVPPGNQVNTGDSSAAAQWYPTCAQWERRYLCTDSRYDGTDEACDPAAPPAGNSANARSCQGAACRCPSPIGCPMSEYGWPYESYFRRYTGNYERAPVATVTTDIPLRMDVPVACYGFYEEFDTKTRQTDTHDRRCIIDMDVAEFPSTQTGKGSFGEGGPPSDPDDPLRERKSGAFDVEHDSWFERLSGGLSFYNPRTGSLRAALGNLDAAEFRGNNQISAEQPLAQYTTMRAFDDTGDMRTLARWWQKQETAAATLLSPPALRVILPAAWVQYGVASVARTRLAHDPNELRDETVEVQISSGEDLLGDLLRAIERTFLRLREVPIPVVLPLASPTELRALAQDWCTEFIERTGKPTCDSAPADVQTLMESLRAYADRVEDIRILRALLAESVGRFLTAQNSVLAPLRDWMNAQIALYRQHLLVSQSPLPELRLRWQEVQDVFTRVHEKANAPWCMNQRYTIPIYSLLDPWLPARRNAGSLTEADIPSLEDIPIRRTSDVTLNFSIFARDDIPIRLPVLKPILVRLRIEDYYPREGPAPVLPPLPDISAIRATMQSALASLPHPCGPGSGPPCPADLRPPTTIPPSPLPDDGTIQRIREILRRMKEEVLEEMERTYDKFWRNLNAQNDPTLEEKKDNLRCEDFDTDPCVYTEMELMEEFTRIGSRPAVTLKEDIESRGAPRTFPGTCLPSDDACLLLPPEHATPVSGWQIRGKGSNADGVAVLRQAIRAITFPEPVGALEAKDLPPYDTDIRDLLQSTNIPEDSDLLPPSP